MPRANPDTTSHRRHSTLTRYQWTQWIPGILINSHTLSLGTLLVVPRRRSRRRWKHRDPRNWTSIRQTVHHSHSIRIMMENRVCWMRSIIWWEELLGWLWLIHRRPIRCTNVRIQNKTSTSSTTWKTETCFPKAIGTSDSQKHPTSPISRWRCSHPKTPLTQEKARSCYRSLPTARLMQTIHTLDHRTSSHSCRSNIGLLSRMSRTRSQTFRSSKIARLITTCSLWGATKRWRSIQVQEEKAIFPNPKQQKTTTKATTSACTTKPQRLMHPKTNETNQDGMFQDKYSCLPSMFGKIIHNRLRYLNGLLWTKQTYHIRKSPHDQQGNLEKSLKKTKKKKMIPKQMLTRSMINTTLSQMATAKHKKAKQTLLSFKPKVQRKVTLLWVIIVKYLINPIR